MKHIAYLAIYGGNMEKEFENVLDNDEVVVKAWKSNKKRYYLGSWIWATIATLAGIIGAVSFALYPGEETIPVLGVTGFICITAWASLFFAWLYYRNVYYCYTNKRIIIKSGIIGVDYHSLYLKSITAINVHVGLLDKLAGKNTGTILFGAASNQIGGGQNGYNPYRFACLVDPYTLYKELKTTIDEQSKKEEK